MSTRGRFWGGVVAGILATALAGGSSLWWMTGSNRPHKHVYGRWRAAAPIYCGSGPLPANDRHCLRCGWRDWNLATPNMQAQK